MRLLLLGGLFIILPALVVVLSFWGSYMMFPALVSLVVAALPFGAFVYIARLAAGGSEELQP